MSKFCEMNANINHIGEVSTSRVNGSPAGAKILTSTNVNTGGVRDTLDGKFKKMDQQFQDRFNTLAPIPWTPNTEIKANQSLQVFEHEGLFYLPNVKLLPFTTGATFNTDNWILSELATIERTLKINGFSPAINPAINSTVSDVDLLYTNGTAYPLSQTVSGAITEIIIVASIPFAIVGSKKVYLLDIKYYNHNYASFRQYWAKGDLTQDDYVHIQTCIDDQTDYEWKGSVKATREQRNSTRKWIYAEAGSYKISKGIIVQPNQVIKADPITPSWFMAYTGGVADAVNFDAGCQIVPDFAGNLDEWVFNSAPFDATGVRRKEFYFYVNNQQLDNFEVAGVDGVTIENIIVAPSWQNPNKPFGVAKLTGINNHIVNMYGINCGVSVHFNACWANEISDSLFQCHNGGLTFSEGTVNTVNRVYEAKLGLESSEWKGNYPDYLPKKDNGVFNAGSVATTFGLMLSNTGKNKISINDYIPERFSRPIVSDNSSAVVNNFHTEGVGSQQLTCKNSYITFNGYTAFLKSTDNNMPIGRFDGGYYTFTNADFGCASGFSYITNETSIDLLGVCKTVEPIVAQADPNWGLFGLTQYTIRTDGYSSIYYEKAERSRTIKMYVNASSGTADDNLYGYNEHSALKTVNQALRRCHKGRNMDIYVSNPDSQAKAENWSVSPTLENSNVNINVERRDVNYTIKGLGFYTNCNITVSDINFSNATSFDVSGNCSLIFANCDCVANAAKKGIFQSSRGGLLTISAIDNTTFSGVGVMVSSLAPLAVVRSGTKNNPDGGWGESTHVKVIMDM